jgi:hypothetical protein
MRHLLILPALLLSLLFTPILSVYLAEAVKWVKVGLWLFVDGD